MNKLLQNPIIRYTGILLIGIAIGAIFYPSKTITKTERRTYEQKITKLQTEKKDIELEYSMRLLKENQTHNEYKHQTTSKLHSLKQENFKLKSKITEKRFKIIKPDGTIEERFFKESETDVVSSVITSIKSEFTSKVASIEKKWQKVHIDRVTKIKEKYEKQIKEKEHTIATLTKTEKTEINKRNFGVSVGMTTEKNYFSSITKDLFGPLFIDIHVGADKDFSDQELGVGLGIKF